MKLQVLNMTSDSFLYDFCGGRKFLVSQAIFVSEKPASYEAGVGTSKTAQSLLVVSL